MKKKKTQKLPSKPVSVLLFSNYEHGEAYINPGGALHDVLKSVRRGDVNLTTVHGYIGEEEKDEFIKLAIEHDVLLVNHENFDYFHPTRQYLSREQANEEMHEIALQIKNQTNIPIFVWKGPHAPDDLAIEQIAIPINNWSDPLLLNALAQM